MSLQAEFAIRVNWEREGEFLVALSEGLSEGRSDAPDLEQRAAPACGSSLSAIAAMDEVIVRLLHSPFGDSRMVSWLAGFYRRARSASRCGISRSKQSD
jgi:hypothetical protein